MHLRPHKSHRWVKILGISTGLLVLILSSALGGFYVARVSSLNPFPSSKIENSQGKVDFSVFWEAWNILDQKFYGNLDNTKRLNGAIAGMVAGLQDPYTVYLEPIANRQFRSQLEGSFGGIGAELIMKDGQLTIVSALEGTPAAKAGLQGGDIIVKINQKKVADSSFAENVDAIRGTKGSTVHLTISRKNVEKLLELDLVRDTIVVKSVTSSALGANNQIAYVKVNQFGQDTVGLLQTALEDAKNSNKKGLIIDLRDDPGGFLDASVQALGMILPAHPSSSETKLQQRVAVLERHKDGTELVHTASNSPIVDQLPLVVLVNGGSASASEIFSGAIKDYKRGTVLGTKTFGKGSVQTLVDLPNGGSIKVTIAKWFTPLGVGIDGKGIDPDVVVPLPDNTLPSTTDAQVSKALELLQAQTK